MTTENNNQDVNTDTQNGGGDGTDKGDVISLKKEEYEELVGLKATTGSLKRELKDAQKALEEAGKSKGDTKETPKNQPEEFGLLHKSYLAAVGIKDTDEVELARDIQKRTGLDWDKLTTDEYFQMKLEKLRTEKANAVATDIGDGGSGQKSGAKSDPSYWAQKGTLPTPADIPDRKTRMKIINAIKEREDNSGGTFYNEK